MSVGIVTAKGQTTIPKPVRDKLGLKTGDRVSWTVVDGQAIVRPKNGSPLDIAGIFHDPNRKPLGIGPESEAMMDAIAADVVASAYRKK